MKEKIPNYGGEEIEIQVRSVLMDAWAEVRHDLEYKQILGFPREEELRVLDAIKGSIASCEIMQDHLLILRKQRMQADNISFGDDLEQSWRAIVISLRPRHKMLLQRFGEEQSHDSRVLIRLFEFFDVHMPDDFKKNLVAEHVVPADQKRTIDLAQQVFADVNLYFHRRHTTTWVRRSLDGSLSSFLIVSMLTRLTIQDVQLVGCGEY